MCEAFQARQGGGGLSYEGTRTLPSSTGSFAIKFNRNDLVEVIQGPYKNLMGILLSATKIYHPSTDTEVIWKVALIDKNIEVKILVEDLKLVCRHKYNSNTAFQYLILIGGFRKDFAEKIVDDFQLENLHDLKQLTNDQINQAQYPRFNKQLLIQMMTNLR